MFIYVCYMNVCVCVCVCVRERKKTVLFILIIVASASARFIQLSLFTTQLMNDRSHVNGLGHAGAVFTVLTNLSSMNLERIGMRVTIKFS